MTDPVLQQLLVRDAWCQECSIK